MSQKIALVTGANRGLGFEVCRQLGLLGMQVILTSRDANKGQQAADTLRSEGLAVDFHQLNVTDPDSIAETGSFATEKYGRLDVLVNNAGVYLDDNISIFDLSLDVLRQTFEINTFGAFNVCKVFVPMMRRQNYGRVVNVSSEDGSLAGMSGRTGAYRMSKTALNALTRVMAAELRGTNVKLNALCPGVIATEMGGWDAPRSPAEGADTVIWLATLPDDGVSGGFYLDRQPLEW